MKVMEDEDGSHVGWLWWSWREWMVVGVKGVGESDGGPIRLDRVLPAFTLIAPNSMPGTTNPILRFSNPNFKPSILSTMKIKEEEEEKLLPFNPTVTSLLRWEIRGWGLPYLTTIDESRELKILLQLRRTWLWLRFGEEFWVWGFAGGCSDRENHIW